MPNTGQAAWKTGTVVLALALQVSALHCQTTVTSTQGDRRSLAVTVYNSNLALVRDVRQIRLPVGTAELRLEGLAAQMNPATVHILSLSDPSALQILEQSYHYDLLTPAILLKKYVGHDVTIVRQARRNHSTQQVSIQARLLADNQGPVWQVGTAIVTGMRSHHYIFPRLPKGLYRQPTLLCLIANRSASPQTVETTYLTSGINWKADYIFTLRRRGSTGAFNGWATISNDSGAAYPNALLQLVAGQVHHLTAPEPVFQMEAAKAVPQFGEQPLGEYHLYTLKRRATLANHASLEISLLNSNTVRFTQVFELNGQPYFYRAPLSPGAALREPVQWRLRFTDTRTNSLGVPIPAGAVRVYKTDSQGRPEFLGEDEIPPTPKGEKVNLDVGNAFDIVATRKQTAYRSLGPRSSEVAFEITLRNHQPRPVTVEVNEPIGGQWTILDSNFKYKKTSAFSARFQVSVPANGQAVLRYRATVGW
jgi:hypothetical protein